MLDQETCSFMNNPQWVSFLSSSAIKEARWCGASELPCGSVPPKHASQCSILLHHYKVGGFKPSQMFFLITKLLYLKYIKEASLQFNKDANEIKLLGLWGFFQRYIKAQKWHIL